MLCTVEKRALMSVLAIAKSIADRTSSMPILASVLLRVTGQNELRLEATDLNLSVAATLASENTDEWVTTVSAACLHDVVSRMPGHDVSIRPAPNCTLQLTSGSVVCKLPSMSARDFPQLPGDDGLEFGEVDSAVLREMIDRTLFSVSNDETRFHLNGVFFECDGANARMVSADGHRLSKVDRPLAGGPNLSAGIIVPKKGVQEIKKVIDSASKLSLAVKTPYLFVRGDAMTLAVKLIESQFPPYEKVMPEKYDIEVVFDGDALLAALWRAKPLTKDTRGVMLRADVSGIIMMSEGSDAGSFSETIATAYDGEPWAICFDPHYWYEHIESMAPGDVMVRMLADSLDPVSLSPVADPSHVAVIMPMRPWGEP